MKNIKLTFILGLFVLLTGCEDAYEIEQPGRLDAEAAFENTTDFEAGLFGVYNRWDLSPEISFTTNFTDEISIGFDSGGQGLALFGFVLTPASTAPANFWTRNYRALNAANRLIEAAEAFTPEPEEQARFDEILGQAYALRAYFHFELQSYFTTDYTDDNALGVIAVDFVPTIDQLLLRNTNGEVFGLIEDDLDRAESLLTTESNPIFISQDFVKAFRARLAAYRQDYTTAAVFAEELYNKYGLANRDQYFDMFIDQDNTEIIFKLERTVGDPYDGQGNTGSVAAGGWAGSIWAFTGPGVDGSPFFEMGRSLFNRFSVTDIRFDVNVHPSSVIDPNYAQGPPSDTNDILVVDKYPGSEGQPLMNDLKVFRSAEMLLILAEARAAAGNFNGETNSTASLLKELREARAGIDVEIDLPVYASQAEAFGDILDERRIELAFEGHRYKDLKRLGVRGNRQIVRDPVDCRLNDACMLPPTDFRFTFPIPIVEFNANPGLREQQNPGY